MESILVPSQALSSLLRARNSSNLRTGFWLLPLGMFQDHNVTVLYFVLNSASIIVYSIYTGATILVEIYFYSSTCMHVRCSVMCVLVLFVNLVEINHYYSRYLRSFCVKSPMYPLLVIESSCGTGIASSSR